MSSNNNKDESTLIIMGFAFLGAVAMMIVMAIIMMLTFAAFVLTILAICAWNKPLRLGKLIIMPEEAHAFVCRGMAGGGSDPGLPCVCILVLRCEHRMESAAALYAGRICWRVHRP